MNTTFLTHLTDAVAALDADIARLTAVRDQARALLDMYPDTATAPVDLEASPRLAAAARRADRLASPAPTATRKAVKKAAGVNGRNAPRPCPVAGCSKVCAGGTGLSAHIRSTHPDYASAPRQQGGASSSSNVMQPFERPAATDVASAEAGLAAL